jgi:hypothetical protein
VIEVGNLKWCGKCKCFLPLSEFSKNSAKKDGLQERCTPCRKFHSNKTKHLRKRPTKEQKRKYLLASYKLDFSTFEKMILEQNNVCAICKTDKWDRPSPSIDHCHKTGTVRGLLCNNCNRALGMFKDDLEILKNAVKYIERFC